MNEEQAKKKWCPLARLGDDDGSTFNRRFTEPYAPEPAMCIGHACMWFVLDEGAFNNGDTDDEEDYYCCGAVRSGS